MTEILLINGAILIDPRHPEVVPHSRTLISDGLLSSVNMPDFTPVSGDYIVDCTGCLIMPGLVNAHTHAAMSLLRGIADDLPLDKWLQDYIFPAESKHANPDFVYLGTKLSAVESALGGVTTVADGYFFMEESARAFSEVGLRAIIAQGILDVPTPDAPEAGGWKKRAEAFLSGFPEHELVTPALFCHSPYLCGPETLKAAYELCRKRGIKLFSHVSETAWEVEEIRKKHGAPPVEYLQSLDVLSPDFVTVHGLHLSERERDILAETGAPLVHCPESAMKLASGAAHIQDKLSRGVTVAIGTDGPASNNNLDMFEEMRSASLLAKHVSGDPLALDAPTTVRLATIDGAKALGLDHVIGTLEADKAADLIVVDFNKPHLTPVYDHTSHLVYSAKASDVRHVFVNGKQIVSNGKMAALDASEILKEGNAAAERIAGNLGLPFCSF
jgi:5-methylthioadenosine/S-adenosylhomocysteine deaminase